MEGWAIFIVIVIVLMVLSLIIITLLYQFNVGIYSVKYVPVDPSTGKIPSQPWTTPIFDYSPNQVSIPPLYLRNIYHPFEEAYCATHPGECTQDGWTLPPALQGKRTIQYPNPNNP